MARQKAFALTSGLAPHCVLQRDEHGNGHAQLKGTCAHGGTIEARVFQGKDKEPLRDWRALAQVPDGINTWEATLGDLPTGEYRVEFRVRADNEAVLGGFEVKNVFVGDLWLLAGQSNMQGVGDLNDEVEKPNRLVKCFAMNERWEAAVEPLHWLIDSPDPVHWGCTPEERPRLAKEARENRVKGAGCALTFAKELVKRTKTPIGLVPCAHGGTSMEQWSPDKRDLGGDSLYGSMLRRLAVVGGRVKGVLWYQGESDAGGTAAEVYPQKMRTLIESFRRDFNDPSLPFYLVQLGCFINPEGNGAGWSSVRESQRRLAESVPHCGMSSAIDLPLDDLIHIGTDGLKRLGKRLADLACRDVYGESGLTGGPRLARAVSLNAERTRLKVCFADVHDKLLSHRRVGGFTVHDREGAHVRILFDARIDPQDPHAVVLRLTAAPPAGATLFYGYGLDPLCTLTDARDHAVPAFGPLPLDDVPVESAG